MKWLPGILLALVLGAGLGPSLRAQAPPASPDIPRMVLQPLDARQVSWDFDFDAPVLCDAEGNMYLRPTLPARIDKNPVWKFSPEGRKLVEFAPPTDTDDAGKEFRMGEFTISPLGDFYALTYDGNSYHLTAWDYFLVSYASDGEASSKIHLNLPADFWVDRFAVFTSGEILVTGHYSSRAAEALRGRLRVLILQSDGTLVREVKLTGEAAAKYEEWRASKSPPAQGPILMEGATMGEDGNAYLLRGTEVLVLSSQGKLLRTIPVSPPEPGFIAMEIQVSQGVLSVVFNKVGHGRIKVMFRTFDASTGVLQAEYVPGPELSNVPPLCFNGAEGYTFLGKKDGKPALVRAWVR